MNANLLTKSGALPADQRADAATIAEHVAMIRDTIAHEDALLEEARVRRHQRVAEVLAAARGNGVPMAEIEAAAGITRQAILRHIKQWFQRNGQADGSA